MAHMKQKQEG